MADRKLLIFPVEQEAAASAYCDAVNQTFRDLTGDPNEMFCDPNLRDRYDQRVIGYFGPDGLEWNGQPVPEPAELVPLREMAVFATSYDPPLDEEEEEI